MTAPTPSTDANSEGLKNEIRELILASDVLLQPADPDDHLDVLALGAVLLARELAAGVIGEAAAEPPRGLNATRLARHLWETEIELHYVSEEPDLRSEQQMAREAKGRLEMWRSHRKPKRPPISPELKRILEAAEQRAKEKDAAAEERRAAGDPVTVDDWGTMPTTLAITKALGRKAEYFVYYGTASLMSHPSVFALDEKMVASNEGVVPAQDDGRAVAMALSLTRTCLARLLLRASRLRRDAALSGELETYMAKAGIAETGVLGLDE